MNNTPVCIDLRSRPPYRCHNEIEARKGRAYDDAWDLILLGAAGFVAPFGGEQLLACTDSRATTKRVLALVPDAVIHQDGTDGQNVRFHVSHLDAVAGILRLRKRRQVSEEQREAARARYAANPSMKRPVSRAES